MNTTFLKRDVIVERFYQYALLMRLDKPIGIFLLLWPTLWALWIAAEGWPNGKVLTIFMLGVFLMRAAGCVINDYADRHIDPHVTRTQRRPMAAGRVKEKEALILFAVLGISAFALVLMTNVLTIALSFGGAFLATLYPFMKRYTYMPQVVLGAAFAWAVPMGFAAQTGSVPNIAWLVFTATVLWTVAYDTMYAMVDREDDRKIGVKSTAILFGDLDRLIVGILQITVLFILGLIGANADLGFAYHLGLCVAGSLALYQQYLIWDRAPPRCFKAFLNNNWFGMAVFLGLFFDYL